MVGEGPEDDPMGLSSHMSHVGDDGSVPRNDVDSLKVVRPSVKSSGSRVPWVGVTRSPPSVLVHNHGVLNLYDSVLYTDRVLDPSSGVRVF